MRISDWSSDVCSSDLSCSGAIFTVRSMTKGEFAGHKKERQTCENSCSSRRRCSHLRYRAPQWLNIMVSVAAGVAAMMLRADMTAIRSEEHTSELQSLMRISYAVSCLQQKINSKLMNST